MSYYVCLYIYDSIQDRQPVSEHLPLAWTHSTEEEEMILMTRLEELKTRFLITKLLHVVLSSCCFSGFCNLKH